MIALYADVYVTNRRNRLNKPELVRELKFKLAKTSHFKSHCYCCGRVNSKRGMTYHHLWYNKTDAFHRCFKNSYDYYLALEPQIIKNPKRFKYLCSQCHSYISKLRQIKNNGRIKRMCKVAIETQYYSSKQLRDMFHY